MKNKKIRILAAVLLFVMASLALSIGIFSAEGDASAEEMELYFPTLNNHISGDCCIIKIGDTEILIDAGGRARDTEAGTEIVEKMREVISADGHWDYIVVTHGDEDHIAGFRNIAPLFVASDSSKEPEYTLGTLIDFEIDRGDDEGTATKTPWFTSQIYESYKKDFREKLTDTTAYYTASQCCHKTKEGATDTFDLGGGAELKILYNYFYDHREGNVEDFEGDDEIDSFVKPGDAAFKNLISVCCLITHGTQKFLFTGDLEEFDTGKNDARVGGESYLLKENWEELADGVTFYKAAHHGSRSSSSKGFIDTIRPDYVMISCCAGEGNGFPSQGPIDHLFTYTDKIYITSKENESIGVGEPYYGAVTFTSDGKSISATSEYECDQNGVPKRIQETEWFRANRNDIFNIFTLTADATTFSNCTLLKYGSIDILIDCGVFSSDAKSVELAKKVESYCVDGVIECAIVTTAQQESMGGFFGSYQSRDSKGKCASNANGLFDLVKIERLVEFGVTGITTDGLPDTSPYLRYLEQKAEANVVADKATKTSIVVGGSGINQNAVTVEILDSKFYKADGGTHSEDDYSVCVLVTFCGEEFLFTGDLTNTEGGEEYLIKKNPKIDNVTFYRAANYASKFSNSEAFLAYVAPQYIVVDCMPSGLTSEKGSTMLDIAVAKRLLANRNSDGKVCITGDYKLSDSKKTIGGDIVFYVKTMDGKVISDGMGFWNLSEEVLLKESAYFVKNQNKK